MVIKLSNAITRRLDGLHLAPPDSDDFPEDMTLAEREMWEQCCEPDPYWDKLAWED